MRAVAFVSLALPWMINCTGGGEGPIGERSDGNVHEKTAGDAALGVAGGPVSELRAEATAVAHHLALGTLSVETARGSHVGRLTAVDFDGAPAFHLVFTSQDAGITSPLVHVTTRGPQLLDDETGTSTVVGASEEQAEVSVSEAGLGLLFDLGETITALGGAREIGAIVAPFPGMLLVRDRAGIYWDTSTRTALAADTITERRKEFEAVRAEHAAEWSNAAREGWSVRRSGPAQTPDIGFESVVTPRGNLDLSKAIDATLGSFRGEQLRISARNPFEEELEATSGDQRGFWNSSQENCTSWWFFGWHSSCDHVEVGGITEPEANQAHVPWQSRGNTIPMCVPFRDPDQNAALGCGPAAFLSLVWAEVKGGGRYDAAASFPRAKLAKHDKIDANYKEFSNLLGQSVFEAMNTCSFGEDGSMTTPWGYQNGANRLLRANGSTKQSRMLSGNLDRMARTLHDRVGMRAQPTVAGFDTGFASAHWSPVFEYRIVRPAGLGQLQIYVKSLDMKDRWYALHGIRLLSALTWFE